MYINVNVYVYESQTAKDERIAYLKEKFGDWDAPCDPKKKPNSSTEAQATNGTPSSTPS